jgi:hypothetical protein
VECNAFEIITPNSTIQCKNSKDHHLKIWYFCSTATVAFQYLDKTVYMESLYMKLHTSVSPKLSAMKAGTTHLDSRDYSMRPI